MNHILENYRKLYKDKNLLEINIPKNPIILFHKWFTNAIIEYKYYNYFEVNAMSLSTIDLKGFPDTRIVLLKEYNNKGFIFYTNYKSKKGKSININNKVCVSFFWPKIQKQIVIKGYIKKISKKKSNIYFEKRPQNHKINAIISKQSKIIQSRKFLIKKFNNIKNKFKNKNIKKPEFWGGYIINHFNIEFWQGRKNRLHDRISYLKNSNNIWDVKKLYP